MGTKLVRQWQTRNSQKVIFTVCGTRTIACRDLKFVSEVPHVNTNRLYQIISYIVAKRNVTSNFAEILDQNCNVILKYCFRQKRFTQPADLIAINTTCWFWKTMSMLWTKKFEKCRFQKIPLKDRNRRLVYCCVTCHIHRQVTLSFSWSTNSSPVVLNIFRDALPLSLSVRLQFLILDFNTTSLFEITFSQAILLCDIK